MNYKELAKDILKLHKPDPQVILEIAREQQETLKKFDESFKEGVEVLAKAHAQLIEAQESEAVWKTEADKADQRRLEAESRLAEAEDLIKRGHNGWQKAEAEVAARDEELREVRELLYERHKDVLVTDERAEKAEYELAELWSRFDKQMQAEAEVERLRDAFSHLTDEIECTPKCSSHQAGYCDCGRLDRAYAIADSITHLNL